MPFCHVTLRGQKPLPPEYPRELTTIGNHIRKRRLELGIRQEEAAGRIGVGVNTLLKWETGWHKPTVRLLPAVVRFLGYEPAGLAGAGSEGAGLRALRRAAGLSQEEFARRVGVSQSLVSMWELGKAKPAK